LDSITGFQVKNFDEMLTRLQSLIESRDLRLKLGVAATQHVKQFDWDVVVRQWEKTLVETSPKLIYDWTVRFFEKRPISHDGKAKERKRIAFRAVTGWLTY